MKNEKVITLLSILCMTLLNGCDILSDIEFFPDTDNIERDYGNNLNLLNEVFNGTIDRFGNSMLEDYSDYEESNEVTKITKNINDLEYYDYGMNKEGKVKALVIPIDFSDYPAKKIEDTNYNINYQSVKSFYYNSSYGKLDFEFDILDYQRMQNPSNYYRNKNYSSFLSPYSGEAPGVSYIINELLKKLDDKIDFSIYDGNNDGYIDSLYIVYSRPYDEFDSDFWWAYKYYYFEEDKFDGVSPYGYVFASYDFIFENNSYTYSAETFIHETGHVLDIEDYYDYDTTEGYNRGGLGGVDMQDLNLGDHNPFTKMSLGWINPIVVELKENEKEKIYKIRPFYQTGDFLLLADSYDNEKGMFQDYFILDYFIADSKLNKNIINEGSPIYHKNGVKAYRVHGELSSYDGTECYKYDNSYTEYNIIDSVVYDKVGSRLYANREYLDVCASDNDLFIKGCKSGTLKYYDSRSTTSKFEFEIIDLDSEYAYIKITKK